MLAPLAKLSEKLVAEMAMLLLCAAGVQDQDDGVRLRIGALAARLGAFARSDTVLAGICLEPGLARDHALAHTILELLGFPDAEFTHLLSESLATCPDVGPERLPHRMLEQEWLVRLMRAPAGSPPEDPGLPSRSALGRPMDALFCTVDDVYAFTHAVMYFSDLGQRRPPLPRPASAIGDDADAALAFSLERDDFDLAGEVLLTWPMLRLPWTTSASFAFSVLASSEDELGFVPAPTFDRRRYDELQGNERADYALVSSYHTNFIWGFLCASSLRPGCAPTRLGGVFAPVPEASDLLQALGGEPNQPAWRRAAADLPSGVRDTTIAPLAITALLRRAAQAGDLKTVHQVLRHALACDIFDSVAPRQAAALLRRSTLLDALKRRPDGVAAEQVQPSDG